MAATEPCTFAAASAAEPASPALRGDEGSCFFSSSRRKSHICSRISWRARCASSCGGAAKAPMAATVPVASAASCLEARCSESCRCSCNWDWIVSASSCNRVRSSVTQHWNFANSCCCCRAMELLNPLLTSSKCILDALMSSCCCCCSKAIELLNPPLTSSKCILDAAMSSSFWAPMLAKRAPVKASNFTSISRARSSRREASRPVCCSKRTSISRRRNSRSKQCCSKPSCSAAVQRPTCRSTIPANSASDIPPRTGIFSVVGDDGGLPEFGSLAAAAAAAIARPGRGELSARGDPFVG
mmetsp:Transcript_45906/g.98086  ORF Transcript_45906/g.98086 Transcript_45906/m.98086 type:complete len:299 (-) Transcript_45906:301-1197(-)